MIPPFVIQALWDCERKESDMIYFLIECYSAGLAWTFAPGDNLIN
jgi:hypothetical protein